MALEASIVERLQELRKWQIDQQERLLKQQQEQRELLSIEQERMYEALGLSIKDVIIDESIIDEMSVSKIKLQGDASHGNERAERIFHDESQETPNVSKQQIITSKDNSPNYSNLHEESNIQLNVPNVCLKAFDTDLTISDSSNYQALPQYKPQIENDQAIDETPKRSQKNHPDMPVKRVEPVIHDRSISKCVQIDELPVPSPKKDFKTLLEEKLRDDKAEIMLDKPETKNKVKRPFLRKGEGLARFRFNATSTKVKKPVKSRNPSHHTTSSNITSQKCSTRKVIEKPKVNSSNRKINDTSRRSVSAIPHVPQQKLILSNVPLPKKTVRNSRSLPPTIPSAIAPANFHEQIEKCILNDESNPSDLDTSKLETKMFEMLEEKAENSSFCSTSSAVIAFMQQSTPIKLKNIRKNLPSQKQIPGATLQPSDTVLNEIVDTLRSNKITDSSVMKIRKSYGQKDIVMSKWNSGPFMNGNSHCNAQDIQQSTCKIVQPADYEKMHQINNNNVDMNDSNEEENTSNLSSSTELESVSENNSRNTLNNSLNGDHESKNKKTDPNVSMHVRFAEYNEYKTIGLTDTSTLSTDSRLAPIGEKKGEWENYSDSEEFTDSETSPRIVEMNRQHLSNNTPKPMNPSHQCKIVDGNGLMNHKILSARGCNDNTENSDTNSADRDSDDDTSVFNDSDGTYYDGDITISGIQEAMAKISSKNDRIELNTIDEMKSTALSKLSTTNDTVFKSDLLKNRLLELEREIDIFRKENAALSSERNKLQDERRQLHREFKEKELSLEHERNEMNVAFQEEKKRLTREKLALENRLRDAREKSIQAKHERQEIQMLSEQLNDLREDIAEKESRWQAAQARQRSQTRVLQMENSKLKSEIERLQSTKRVGGKLKRPNIISNTKAIHQINRELDIKRNVIKKQVPIAVDESETVKVIHERSSDAPVTSPVKNHTSSPKTDMGKIIVCNPVTVQKPMTKLSEETISKKRHLYDTLLKDATVGYNEQNHEKSSLILDNDDDEVDVPPTIYDIRNDDELKFKPCDEDRLTCQPSSDIAYQSQNKLPYGQTVSDKHDIAKVISEKREQVAAAPANDVVEPQQIIRGSYQQFVRDIINPRNEANRLMKSNTNGMNSHSNPDVKNSYQESSYVSDKTKPRSNQIQTMTPPALMDGRLNRTDENVDPPVEEKMISNVNNRLKLVSPTDSDLTPRKEHQNPMPRPSDDTTPRPEHIQVSQICDLPPPRKFNSSSMSPAHYNIREVKHPDGHSEYWYPNGNVKRVYPDRNITKMIYYNGDVRETTSDGCVKYFYAATKTWHTTYPDGFEMLEFPDGQQERRTKDGVVEVCFPDGSVRLMQPDGIEKWALPDGTIAETFPNGEKILSLPNGQREIHTAEHKRREYPDGTVKFVYPDGSQETRYPNGRIRIKNKDGHLVMDSHQM